jgi:hypothetical protein
MALTRMAISLAFVLLAQQYLLAFFTTLKS